MRKKHRTVGLRLAPLLTCAITTMLADAHATPPATINVHGALTAPDGSPLTGARAYIVKFYDAQTAGTQLGGDLTGTTTLSPDGLFNIAITPPSEVFSASAIWYELAIDTDVPVDNNAADDVFPARTQVHSVPFAQQSAEADHVDVENVGNGLLTSAEFDFLTGLTSNVQTQLDDHMTAIGAKANTADVYTKAEVDTSQTTQDTTIAGKFARQGTAHIVVETTDDPATNAANLLAAYVAAKSLQPGGFPLSATNRAVVLVSPGPYNLGTGQLTLDAEFVDLVGLSTARDDQYLYGTSNGAGTGVLAQTADNVRIENLLVHCTRASGGLSYNSSDPAAHFPNGALANVVVRNCEFRADATNAWSMRIGVEYRGFYSDCAGGMFAFGGDGTASGTFTRCTGGDYAFGFGISASGTFVDCTGGRCAFGGGGTASGTFTNCSGADGAFGGDGTASGTFTNCTAGYEAFGSGMSAAASGTFIHCTGGNYAFGNGPDSTAGGGRFYHCVGGVGAFTEDGSPAPVHLFCIQNGAQYSGNN